MLKGYITYATQEKEDPSSEKSTGRNAATRSGILLVIIFVLLIAAVPASGQRNGDIGFFVGVPWYMGDLSSTLPVPHELPPAIGPIYRHNFNMRNALRAHAIFYTLSDSVENFRGEVADFESSFVDLGLDFEFNWWPYKTADRKNNVSPYVSAGLGYSLNYSGNSVSHLYVPFGGGVKMNLGKRVSGGLEVSARKTFTDLIDGVANLGGEEVQTPVGNNDWYFFTGVFVTFKIFNYREECPTYD